MKNKNIVKIITIIITVVVLIIGIFIVVKNINNNTEVVKQGQDINKDKTIINGVDISDWKTYRNEEYGYLIKYPEDWEMREFPDTKTGADFTDGNYKIVIDIGVEVNKPFNKYVYKSGSGIQNYESINSIKKIIINNRINGYIIKWNVRLGYNPDKWGVSSESAYFEAKKYKNFSNTDKVNTIRVSHGFTPTEYSTKIFNTMIQTFDYID